MATKLTSSLRKSISAEKATVEKKVTKSTPRTTVKKPVVKAAEDTQASTTTAKTSVPKAPIDVEIKSAPQEKVKLVQQKNSDDIYKLVQTISNSNQQFIDYTLQAIQAVNQDIANYLYEVVDPQNISDIAKLNNEFLTKLRLRQEAFWQNSLEIINKIIIK